MEPDGVPPWCRWRLDARPLLLVAPHGGQCREGTSTSGAPRQKVNDLYTAEITAALAARLGASFIVNSGLDRNELDLNRISHVSRRAPWFLSLLESMLDRLLQRHSTVEVWLIHGWNVVQPKCDIGIGARLSSPTDIARRRDALTVSPGYFPMRLEPLRMFCRRVGVHATYGDRYPASHPNNLLQLFRPTREGGIPSARLAGWAAARRIEAVQLELAIPLRWEGAIRDRFLTAVEQSFSSLAHATPDPTPAAAPQGALCPPPTALAFHDPRAGVGLIASVATTPDGRLGGRLLAFDRAGGVALFTGDDAPAGGAVLGGPKFVPRPQGFGLRFSGPLLQVNDGALYLHLERAFSRSRLIDARVDLVYRPIAHNAHGSVTGVLRLGERRARIHALAFAQVALLQRATDAAPLRATFAAAFDRQTAIHVRHPAAASASRIDVSGPALQPDRLSLELGDGSILAVLPVNRIVIRRPLAGSGQEIINLGVALFRLNGDRTGAGVFEYARRSAPGRAAQATRARAAPR